MIKKKLVVANGKYITKDGSEKTRWVNVGDPEPMKNNFQKSNDFASSQPDEEIPF